MRRPGFLGIELVTLATFAVLAGCGHSTQSSSPAEAAGGSSATEGAQASPALQPISGTLTGLYVDVSGGPLFTECGHARSWPVVSGGVGGELNRAYLSVRDQPGDAARVTVQAHTVPKPGSEGGQGLVIDKVVLLTGEPVCPGQQADQPLAGTTWRAVSLERKSIDPEDGPVTIRMDEEAKTVQVSTGCRLLSGTFRWVGTQLTFGSIDAGDMRCPATARASATALDASVMDMLRATGSYAIRGDTLELMGENGVVGRFASGG